MRWSFPSALAFLLFGALVLGALNLAGRIPIHGPTPPQEMKAAFDRIAGKEAVSLGGSVGTAIDFDAMCLSGTPFWNNGQDLFEAEALVDLILSRPDPPRLYFLVISPTSLGHDNGLPSLGGTYRRRFTYRFLHAEGHWGLIGGDWRQAFQAQAMPAKGEQLRNPWHAALLDALQLLPPPDPGVLDDTRSIDPRQAPALAKATMAEWQENAEDVAYFDPQVGERTSAALLRIADRIDARGGRLIVVSPPYIDELVQPMQQAEWSRIDRFDSVLAQLEARGALVINEWDNRGTRYGLRHFRDPKHLNAPGARAFSRQIDTYLARKGIVDRRACS
ncbi:MAG: hypothetical protein CL808_03000 [Citromicrobium sp.]|nr:hypothetical protein [Citromicrobium sp.]